MHTRPASTAQPTGRPVTVVRSVAGPDSGWSLPLSPGRYRLGRATDGIRLADPAVEAHHALLDVDPSGAVTVLQITGRTPMRLDGAAASGRTRLAPGAVIELGHSRLHVGDRHTAVPPSTGSVLAPLDRTGAELERFARDVERAVAASLAVRPASTTSVVLGYGRAVVPLTVRGADGEAVPVERLDHPVQQVLDRVAAPVAPITTDLTELRRIGIAAPDPGAVAAAIVHQLPPRRRAGVEVVAAHDTCAAHTAHDHPVIVITTDIGELPEWCTALLDVGHTWWATWQPDVEHAPERIVRLHARGRTADRPAGHPTPAAAGCARDRPADHRATRPAGWGG